MANYNGSRIREAALPPSCDSLIHFHSANTDGRWLHESGSGHFGAPSLDSRKMSDAPSDDDALSASAASGSGAARDAKYRLGSRVFLLVSVVSALLIVGLEAFMFGALTRHRSTFVSDQRYYQMAIYLALFIFAACYQVFLTSVGLRTKNMLLLTMLGAFYSCMLVYTGIQYHEVSRNAGMGGGAWGAAVHATNIATIGVLALTVVVQSLLIYFVLWRGVRWFTFKKIGASLAIKRLYSYFQLHRNLLVFDFFFFLGFTVQFIVIMVGDKRSLEFILTCCMLPLTLLVLFLSDFAATRELVWLTLATASCFAAGGAYVVFKVVRLYTKYTAAYNVAVSPGSYFPGRTALVAFGVITLLFLLVTIAMEAVMIHGYNRGLLPYVRGSCAAEPEKDDADFID